MKRTLTDQVGIFMLIAAALGGVADIAIGQGTDHAETRDNFMVVLRNTERANKLDEKLAPTGTMQAILATGEKVEMKMAHFEFIGDMHVRFVFDGPSTMAGARPEVLDNFGLTPEQAIVLAVENVRRVYGAPAAYEIGEGIFQVQGTSPDLDSSYFLDTEFWEEQSRHHTEGIVVAVPSRGGLLFTPATNQRGVAIMRNNVAGWYLQAERHRVSSALYIRRENRWEVFQRPSGP